MAHHHAGKAKLLLHADDQVVDGLRHEGVEAGSRLIEQDNFRFHDQGARQGRSAFSCRR